MADSAEVIDELKQFEVNTKLYSDKTLYSINGYDAHCRAELSPVRHASLRNVPLSDIVQDTSYEVSSISGLRNAEEFPISEGREVVEEQEWFNGFGLQLDSGPVAYVTAPRFSGTWSDEFGHPEMEYLLEGYVEFENGQSRETVEEGIEFGDEIMHAISQNETKQTQKIRDAWVEETGYNEKGILGKLKIKLFTGRPDILDAKNVNPRAVRLDSEDYGLQASQLLEAEKRL